MSEGGITLGQFLIGMAALDLVALPLLVRSVRRANPGSQSDRRRATIIVIGAVIATAIGLCLVGLYWPDAQMRLY
ncbi:MAG TPA: hypothetical protein VE053_14345 [Allosphingosinicella sp.]|nr:hypothetical protein [Allosphingosinicella sp.]